MGCKHTDCNQQTQKLKLAATENRDNARRGEPHNLRKEKSSGTREPWQCGKRRTPTTSKIGSGKPKDRQSRWHPLVGQCETKVALGPGPNNQLFGGRIFEISWTLKREKEREAKCWSQNDRLFLSFLIFSEGGWIEFYQPRKRFLGWGKGFYWYETLSKHTQNGALGKTLLL